MNKEEADKECCRSVPEPRGWVQWKGTDACIDVYCVCGHDAHIHDDFLYYWKCGGCGKVHALDPVIRLIEITEGPEPDGCIVES